MSSVYAYVGNNPISNVDPLGLYASCSCKNGVEHINIPITFTGKGATPAVVQDFTNAIESEWSTKNFVVSVTSGPQNQITIIPGGYDFAQTDACAWGNCNASGTWGGANPGSVAAHEAAHLMGVPDQYVPMRAVWIYHFLDTRTIHLAHGGSPSRTLTARWSRQALDLVISCHETLIACGCMFRTYWV